MITEKNLREEWKFDRIKELIEKEPWEDDPENRGSQLRTVHLGSIFSITPSGKVYAPFANSNVAGCDGCNGTGHTRSKYKHRVQKKRAARQRVRAKWVKIYGYYQQWPARIKAKSIKLNQLNATNNPECWRCGGTGSAEAYDDSIWNELMEKLLSDAGLGLHYANDEIYAAEFRDTSEREERDGTEIDGEKICADCLQPDEYDECLRDPEERLGGEEDFTCTRCKTWCVTPDASTWEEADKNWRGAQAAEPKDE
jgi:hypothetical protein